MKKLLPIAALILAPMALIGSTTFSWSCGDGVSWNGNCAPGHVTFSGASFPTPLVHITVTRNADGNVYDDFDYETQGNLLFTETLVPAGTYTVLITTPEGFAETRTVTTGGWYHDDH